MPFVPIIIQYTRAPSIVRICSYSLIINIKFFYLSTAHNIIIYIIFPAPPLIPTDLHNKNIKVLENYHNNNVFHNMRVLQITATDRIVVFGMLFYKMVVLMLNDELIFNNKHCRYLLLITVSQVLCIYYICACV